MKRQYFIVLHDHSITSVDASDHDQIDFLARNQGAIGPFDSASDAQDRLDRAEMAIIEFGGGKTMKSKPSLFVDCPSCGKGERHMDGCPLESEIPAIPATTELHPAGTRARIAALEDQLAQIEAQREMVLRERDAAIRLLRSAVTEHESAFGLLAKFIEFTECDEAWQDPSENGETNPLWLLLQHARDLIGVVPVRDVSDPGRWVAQYDSAGVHAGDKYVPEQWGGGLAPLDATKRAQYVNASPLQFINNLHPNWPGASNDDPTTPAIKTALMEAFDCDGDQADAWINEWILEPVKANRAQSGAHNSAEQTEQD